MATRPGSGAASSSAPSLTENCVAIIARTDPNEQESVVLLPHLDEKKLAPPVAQ